MNDKDLGQGHTVYKKCTNSPSVVGSSVVSLKVLKLDPTFWVFKITSAAKYGSCLVVKRENTEPKQK